MQDDLVLAAGIPGDPIHPLVDVEHPASSLALIATAQALGGDVAPINPGID
jgi:hypothetical protein